MGAKSRKNLYLTQKGFIGLHNPAVFRLFLVPFIKNHQI